MVTPVGAHAHIDVPLSNLAVAAFSEGVDEFIGDQVFPAVPVPKQSDLYYTLTKDSFFRTTDALRAPKTAARRIEFQVSTDTFYAHNYALAGENALEDLANADMAIMLRENTVRNVITDLRRAQEIRVANWVSCASNVGSGVILAGTSKWGDFVNSDPLADVTTGHAFIRRQTGLVANTGIIDWDTLQVVRRHPRLLDLYKYTSGGELTDDQLAQTFRVQRLLIGRAIKENALEGGTSSITNVWGNNFVLAHIEAGTSMQTRTLGLRFQHRPAGFAAPFAVERKIDNGAGSKKVEIVEAGHFQDEKIVARDLGYVIANTL